MTRPVDERAGPHAPADADVSGIDVFISHVEEDGSVAIQLADALEAAGYSTWCYERDTIPGPSYLLQTSSAIAASRAVVVLISADALGSHQVTSEVVRAHEEVKPFIPLLIGISREEFGVRQPEWREAIGSAATLELRDGVRSIVPRIVDGLVALGVAPHEPGTPRARLSYAAPEHAAIAAVVRRRRFLLPAAIAAVLVVVAAVVLVLTLGGGEDKPGTSGGPSTVTPSETSGTSPSASASEATPPGATVKDAATTPVRTAAGPARVTARADTEFCPIGGGACQTAPPGRVFVLVDLEPWKSGTLSYNENTSMEAFSARVTVDHVSFTPVETHTTAGGFTAVFPSVPQGVVGNDLELRWPDNPTVRVHVTG